MDDVYCAITGHEYIVTLRNFPDDLKVWWAVCRKCGDERWTKSEWGKPKITLPSVYVDG